MAKSLTVAGLIILLMVCVVIVIGLSCFGRLACMPINSAIGIAERTLDADNVIYNYEWFKRQHQEFIARKAQLVASESERNALRADLGDDRSSWSRMDREEVLRLGAVVLGIKQSIETLRAEYNARSQMVNRRIFKAGDSELPERL